MLIAIEGIDGSGKGTQAKRLVDHLNGCGRRTALISFPRYSETRFGRAIGEFLNGRFGTLDQVHPFLAALLYAGDRFESKATLEKLLAENDVVVCDRYVASNLAHQGAKAGGEDRQRLIEQIRSIEHGVYGLPQANLTLLLHLPAHHAQRLIAKKAKRDYTDRTADLQEADVEYLQGVSQVYLELAEQGASEWRTIEVATGSSIRSIDEVASEICKVV